ncbi:hypothetical protein NPS42_11110 [Pseudomonas putida]|uniref:hypothetical protein n=1 Tax=Pseudomonas putida TaxID=303 RepID=UPI002363205A|nr:hypothetical protein [Pseudomonas putida]MDD2026343.1 hypothetical protein [Pseudomonas putida]HDS1768176.1 hypothetical protein [Pseudomonas putida]
MKPSDAIRGKESAVKLLIESYGFVSPSLFGSTVRGDDRDGIRKFGMRISSIFMMT